jgi:hypothetical protein
MVYCSTHCALAQLLLRHELTSCVASNQKAAEACVILNCCQLAWPQVSCTLLAAVLASG